MESALRRMFDCQAFEGNTALGAVTGEVHARYATGELSLEELDFIAAAGMPDGGRMKKEN